MNAPLSVEVSAELRERFARDKAETDAFNRVLKDYVKGHGPVNVLSLLAYAIEDMSRASCDDFEQAANFIRECEVKCDLPYETADLGSGW